MLIKINTDSFVESTKIEQYYLEERKIVFYIMSRKHEEIYPSMSFAKNVFDRIANSFRDATTQTNIIKPSEKILSEKMDMFNDFWNRYNKKINRDDCLKKWKKLSIVDMQESLKMIDAYVRSTPEKKYRKNPATWIYQKGWRNEVISKVEQDNIKYKTPDFTNVSR